MKKHPWFSNIDWEALEAKEIKPPFDPEVKDSLDFHHIDEEFIDAPVVMTKYEAEPLLKSHTTEAFDQWQFVDNPEFDVVHPPSVASALEIDLPDNIQVEAV